jgi:hypothetical protein
MVKAGNRRMAFPSKAQRKKKLRSRQMKITMTISAIAEPSHSGASWQRDQARRDGAERRYGWPAVPVHRGSGGGAE